MSLADKFQERRSEPRRLKSPAYGQIVNLDGKLLLFILAVVGLCFGILYFGIHSLMNTI